MIRSSSLVFCRIVLLVAVVDVGMVGTAAWADQGTKKAPKATADQTIGFKTIDDGSELMLDIYLPPSDGDGPAARSRPAIVLFFGGGWVSGNTGHFASQARHFAERGMVAFCPQYRTKSSHGTDPRTCVADGKSAMRFIRANAERWNVDPDRIAAGGGSAGGHVAASTSLVDSFDDANDDLQISCRPTALVLFNPVFDNGPGQWGHSKVSEYWQQISPANLIDADAVPTIIFLGTEDKLISVDVAQRYCEKMKTHGAACELVTYESAGHGFFNKGEPYQDTLDRADRFLVGLGYLKP